MSNQPLVSVTIPCYNQGEFLAAAIESVLGQTFKDIELVVVDDGSTDATREIAGRYAGQVRLISKENAGVSAARNTGILATCGPYLLCLDADDVLCPDALEQHVAVLTAHPDAAVSYGAHDEVDADGSLIRSYEVPDFPDGPYLGLLRRNQLQVGTVMLRRSVLANVGLFDPELPGAEDWDLWLRIAAAGYRFVKAEKARCIYRHHGETLSKHLLAMEHSRDRVVRRHLARNGDRRDVRRAISAARAHFRSFEFQVLNYGFQQLRRRGERWPAVKFVAARILRNPFLIFPVTARGAMFALRRLRRCFGLGRIVEAKRLDDLA
jgi:glycosyltransferase involved in cell wall biosynthesis